MPPWEKYAQVPASAPQQDPVIAVDPYKVQDQQLQVEAAQRAQQDQVRQEQQFQITQQKDAERLQMQQEDQARQRAEFEGTGGKPTEAQQKTSLLLSRIMGGFNTITSVASKDETAQEPGLIESVRGDLMPGGLSGIPARAIAGESRRMVHDAQRDVLDSLLTLGTGAAYTAEQLTGQMASYFPAYGDTQTEIAEKNNKMKLLIAAAKVNAGPKWGEVEAAITPYLKALDSEAPPTGSTVKEGKVYGPDGAYLGASPGAPDGPLYPDGGGSEGGSELSWDSAGRGIAQGAGSIAEAAGEFVGLVGNPLNATINAATGSNLSTDLGTTLREGLGLPDNQSQIGDAVIKGATGALTGSLVGRAASTLARPGVVRNALSQFGATPTRDMAAGAAAGAGGEIGDRIGGTPGRVVGTLAGGVAGYSGANALARTVSGSKQPNALMQAADDLDVTMMPADVGGVGTRMATGAFGRTLGGIPIAEGAQKAIGTAATARGRIAADVGVATDNVGAGQAAKRGFSEFTKNSEKRAGELFENVSVPPESNVQLGQTRGALAEVTRGMQSNPELSRLWANHPRLRATLEALTPKDVAAQGRRSFMESSDRLTEAQLNYDRIRSSVTSPSEISAAQKAVDDAKIDVQRAQREATREPVGGELSWHDMKRFRSIVGEIIGQPGIKRDGSDVAALRKLYGAVTSDMEVTAAQAGPRALQEFRRANQYWRGREDRIDNVFAALLGKDGNKGDEAVFKQINTWAKGEGGDFSRIARTIRSMPQDEANTVRATIIQRMGMAKPANQDATGEVFSPALFSTEWRGMSNRAKNVLFPNKQHRSDLEKLANITDGMKQAGQFQNFSNTSLGTNLSAQSLVAYASPVAAAVLAGLQFGGGKLLASPRFARIVASSAKLSPDVAARRLPDQLKVLATREPLIANDVNAVLRALNDNVGISAAASDSEKDQNEQGR